MHAGRRVHVHMYVWLALYKAGVLAGAVLLSYLLCCCWHDDAMLSVHAVCFGKAFMLCII
jgi:hypothetical protein